MKRLYIAGPMSGWTDMNFPAFSKAAASLRAAGFEVVNPVDVCPDPGMAWVDCMKRDIPAMLGCDGVATLDGWTSSRGAALEVTIAERLGMPVAPLAVWMESKTGGAAA
jgi:nucleoside 2-deoxyribosyltransferase